MQMRASFEFCDAANYGKVFNAQQKLRYRSECKLRSVLALCRVEAAKLSASVVRVSEQPFC
ncbi:MAG: hypothetical protein ACLR7U_11665 [Ruthenibacterium lactatiformans]